ncbi:MAG: FAD-binding oxidoreductase [Thermoleophilia bacterium]|nr:FAD-binding oxidoreductase [Thermoleophilia bacterium]
MVGGGIAGLTAAYMLSLEGLRVAVVEAMRVIMDVTGFTTGKLTTQHGQVYGLISERYGLDKAQLYADANQAALARIISIIEDNSIDCDFQRTDSWLFTEESAGLETIHGEVELALKLGLPASYSETTPMPFTKGAMRFEGQAQFHPRKYLMFLADQVVARGGSVLENTRALDIAEKEPGAVLKTSHGDITAGSVIIATNTPFYQSSLYAPRFSPTRSYVLGVKLEQQVPEGMHYCIDDHAASIRNQPLPGTDERLLMVGCWDKSLDISETEAQYEKVEAYARERLPLASVDYHWFTQDQKTPDRIPWIGRVKDSRHIYVATGFGGWGMTTSGVAGMLLTDMIAGRDTPYAALYDPSRAIQQ